MTFEQMEEWGDIQAGSGETARVEARLEEEVWEARLLLCYRAWALLREPLSIHLPGSSQRKRQSLGNDLTP